MPASHKLQSLNFISDVHSVHSSEANGDVCVREQQDGGGRGGGRALGTEIFKIEEEMNEKMNPEVANPSSKNGQNSLLSIYID